MSAERQTVATAQDDTVQNYLEERDALLRKLDRETTHAAWFTLSHLLLDDGAHVVHMGCGDGAMTYAMAAMNPDLRFTGMDKSKREINKAKEQYELHNLDFKIGDVASDIFDEESLDAIINSYVLHEVYSASRYNERIVSDTLAKHFRALKKDGVMFMQDYARPPPGEYVLMEMPDTPGTGEKLSDLSEPDLLLWYSEHARPRQDPGCGGFFLEELPERIPGTRLFRLPFKWAYEFIMRKDDRAHWEKELPFEYTFFTPRDFLRELKALGARVLYSAPHWDEEIIEKRFEGRFRLYDDDNNRLSPPPTSYIAVAYKMAERKSLNIAERRPAQSEEDSPLKIEAMRDDKTGRIVDVVSRKDEFSEIIPYRIDEKGRLKIYLNDGVVRSITNAVARSGHNIDERRWSGHMIEPVCVDSEALAEIEENLDVKNTTLFARDYLGLKPATDERLLHGPDYYPAPAYIDENIHTYYLRVAPPSGAIKPKIRPKEEGGFVAHGQTREFDAQQVLNSISVGMIPNARLELQILALFEKLGIRAENWTAKHISLQERKILTEKRDVLGILANYGLEGKRFRNIKGTSGDLRPVHSIFVEEGYSKGGVTGLSANTVDFIVHDGQTVNTAVVLPLTKSLKGDIHAGFIIQHMPVLQRREGKSAMISAPTFNLPPHVKTTRQAREYIAEQFGVVYDLVIKVGEPYFAHIGMTPHRIFPFAVTIPPDSPDPPDSHFLPFYQMMLLRKSIAKDTHFMIVLARAYRFLNDALKLDAKIKSNAILKERFENAKPQWSFPISYHQAPSLLQMSDEQKRLIDERKFQLNLQNRKMDFTNPAGQPFRPPPPDITKISPMVVKSKNLDDIAPDMLKDFEKEFEEFVETLAPDKPDDEPKPEKW